MADTREDKVEAKDSQVGSQDRNVQWYNKDLPKLSDSTRKLFIHYSGIPVDKVDEHVYAAREKAWDLCPYPCIGQWRFLEISISIYKLYPEVLERMRSGEQKFLDLGCCLGQDIRRLVDGGIDSTLCYGTDLQLDFMELGYDLFLDRDKLKSKFIAADVFDPDSDLKQLDGQIDIVHAASFFHLFNYEEQKKVAHRMMRILKPKPGSLVLGRQVANHYPGLYPNRTNTPGGLLYWHNLETWRKMWDEVGEEMGGVKFEIQGEMMEYDLWGFLANGQTGLKGAAMLQYSVRRL